MTLKHKSTLMLGLKLVKLFHADGSLKAAIQYLDLTEREKKMAQGLKAEDIDESIHTVKVERHRN